MVNEDAALLNRRVTHMTPAALFSRRLHMKPANSPATNTTARLQMPDDLKAKGLITDDEYQKKRAAILNDL